MDIPFQPSVRRLTVGSKAFIRANHKYVFFPEIVLQGRWLEECGFCAGMQVQIVCTEPGKLMICIVADDLAAEEVPLQRLKGRCG